jgi:hypothetical protein
MRVNVVVLSVTAFLAEVLLGSAFPEASKGTGAAPAPAAITRKTLQTVDVPGSSYRAHAAKVLAVFTLQKGKPLSSPAP